ncbi:hypothetical protein Tco_1382153 [Tanacetum coccineum]
MENAQAESNPTEPITNDNINIDLSKEFLIELKNNADHGMFDEDVVDHIAKVLKLLDSIKIPGVDSHRLRMKVFPLSLADDARQWWINEGEEKITTWEELVEKFFCKFYPESHDGEDEIHDERDIEEGNELRQMKRKEYNKNDEQPNKRDLAEKKSTMLVKYLQSGNLEVLES